MIQIPEEVKEALKDGAAHKIFRVKFPNLDHEEITNENIISESVSLTESLCSQDTLKFGLCENNTIQFETFDVGNIKGKVIDCQLEVDCNDIEYFTQRLTDSYGNSIYATSKADSSISLHGELKFSHGSGTVTDDYIYLYDVDIQAGDISIYEDIADEDIGNPDWLYMEDLNRGFTLQLMADDTVLLETTKNQPYASGTVTKAQLNGVKHTYLRLRVKPKSNLVGSDTWTYVIETTIRPYPRSINSHLYVSNGYYIIPYGRFIVDKCTRNSDDMQRRRVEAYGLFEQAFKDNALYEILKDLFCTKKWISPTAMYVPLEAFTNSFFTLKDEQLEPVQYTESNSTIVGEQNVYTDFEDKAIIYYKKYPIEFDNEWSTQNVASLHLANLSISGAAPVLKALDGASDKMYNELLPYAYAKGITLHSYDKEDLRANIDYFVAKVKKPYYTINRTRDMYSYNDPQAGTSMYGSKTIEVTTELSTLIGGYSESTKYNNKDYKCNVEYNVQAPYKIEYYLGEDLVTTVNLADTFKVEANRYAYITRDVNSTPTHYKYYNGTTTEYPSNEPIITIARDESIFEPATALRPARTSYFHGSDELFYEPSNILAAVLELNGMLGMQEKASINYSKFRCTDLTDATAQETLTKSLYIQAWYDDYPAKMFSAITCTYHNTANEEVTVTHQIVPDVTVAENPEAYIEYDISDNYIIQKEKFTESQIDNIMANMANHIANIHYMPADIDCVGLPYLETGDVIHVDTDDGGFDTIVLRRTLSGIQALEDNIESNG